MDIFFQDPTEITLPPEEVQIRELSVDPYPDGQRLRVYLEVDPFQRPPNLDLIISNPLELEAARVNIIGSVTRKMEFTVHLRLPASEGDYTLRAFLYYVDQEFDEVNPETLLKDPIIVDQASIEFSLPVSE